MLKSNVTSSLPANTLSGTAKNLATVLDGQVTPDESGPLVVKGPEEVEVVPRVGPEIVLKVLVIGGLGELNVVPGVNAELVGGGPKVVTLGPGPPLQLGFSINKFLPGYRTKGYLLPPHIAKMSQD